MMSHNNVSCCAVSYCVITQVLAPVHVASLSHVWCVPPGVLHTTQHTAYSTHHMFGLYHAESAQHTAHITCLVCTTQSPHSIRHTSHVWFVPPGVRTAHGKQHRYHPESCTAHSTQHTRYLASMASTQHTRYLASMASTSCQRSLLE
jgi:hypothetical protein